MGNDMAGPGGKGNVPLPFRGKNISSPERARELNQIALEKRDRRKAANNGVDPLMLYRRVDGRLTAAGLDAAYVSKAFSPPWDDYYRQACRRLRKQYAPRDAPAYQYEILLRRAAALDTIIQALETSPKPDRYLILGHYDRLQTFIAQLQKYTEAEKREIKIEEEVTVTLISQIIGLADATITDPGQRGAFLRALRVQLGDESARLDAPALGLPVIDVVPRAVLPAAGAKRSADTPDASVYAPEEVTGAQAVVAAVSDVDPGGMPW